MHYLRPSIGRHCACRTRSSITVTVSEHRGGWLALTPALVTVVLGVPLAYSARDDGQFAVWLLVAMLVAAPLSAWASNLVRPNAVSWRRAWLVGAIQVPVLMGLMYFMVRLQASSGYLVAGTSDYEIALWYGLAFAAIGATVFGTVPVAVCARLGAYQAASRT